MSGEVNGRLWRIELGRSSSAVLYVLADSRDEALDDALLLVRDEDFFIDDEDGRAVKATTSAGSRVWSGGPDGAWTGPFDGVAPDTEGTR